MLVLLKISSFGCANIYHILTIQYEIILIVFKLETKIANLSHESEFKF